MLFGELHRLLEQANLGSGTEAALIQGRQLIQVRLSQLSLEPQTSWEALLAEEANPTERSLKAQLSPNAVRFAERVRLAGDCSSCDGFNSSSPFRACEPATTTIKLMNRVLPKARMIDRIKDEQQRDNPLAQAIAQSPSRNEIQVTRV